MQKADTIVTRDSIMATLQSAEQKNNLELYLNDVYEKECKFKIEQEEVEFIQTGIETLVQDLHDKILINDSFCTHISHIINGNFYFAIDEMFKMNHLAEVYLPMQSDSNQQRFSTLVESSVKSVNSTVIKVGSFYDGTKNNFPNEFDFILPLLGIRGSMLPIDFGFIDHVQKAIAEYGKSLHYSSLSEDHQVTRQLHFEKFIGIYGPACKTQFIYSNGFGEQNHIHVDLVPAAKIIDSNTQKWIVKAVKGHVKPKTFRKEILSAETCLCVNENLAFTELEQHFMKNILSKKHVKVTRILKHLLNGNGDGEKLEEYFAEKLYKVLESNYTSYCIKVLMICHHDVCTNTDTEDLGPCVIQVLKQMSKYRYVYKEFPWFAEDRGRLRRTFCAPQYLKSTIKTLQLMQTSGNNYEYDKDKIKSVSGQYLDSLCITDPHEYIKTKRSCIIL